MLRRDSPDKVRRVSRWARAVKRLFLLLAVASACGPFACNRRAEVHLDGGNPNGRNAHLKTGGNRVKRDQKGDNTDVQRMELAVSADRVQDFANVRAFLEVRNRGSGVMTWDSEFAVFVFWSVIDDSGELLLFKEGAMLSRPRDNKYKDRFIQIAPGKSKSATVELAKGMRAFKYGVRIPTDEQSDQNNISAYETTIRLGVPVATNRIRIRAIYELVDGAEAAFSSWFGVPVEVAGLAKQRVVSNEVVVERARADGS